jgi:hypothetical protein
MMGKKRGGSNSKNKLKTDYEITYLGQVNGEMPLHNNFPCDET